MTGFTWRMKDPIGLTRVMSEELEVALQHRLQVSVIGRIAFDHTTIEHQRTGATTEKDLMPEGGLAASLLQDVGMLLEDGNHLLGRRYLLASQHPALGLLDHSP